MLFNTIKVYSTKSVTPPVHLHFQLRLQINLTAANGTDDRWKGVAIRKTASIMGWFCRKFPISHPFWRQDHFAPVCMKNLRRASKALQNDLQQANPVHVSGQTVGDRCHEGGMMVPLPKTGSAPAAPCSLTGNCQRTLDFGTRMRAGSYWTHVADVREPGDAVWHVLLPATSSSVTTLAGGQ